MRQRFKACTFFLLMTAAIWGTLVVAPAEELSTTGDAEAPSAGDSTQYSKFKCNFLDSATASEGHLIKNGVWAGAFRGIFDNFVFDASTGLMSIPGNITQWKVIRHGSSQWDLTAHVASNEPIQNILRIQVWNNPIAFMMTNNTDIFTGTCIKISSENKN